MARKAESPVRPPGSPRHDEADKQAGGCDSANSEPIPAGRVRGPRDLRLKFFGFGEQHTWDSRLRARVSALSHVAFQGALQAAYLCFMVRLPESVMDTEYLILFDNSPSPAHPDRKQSVMDQCIILYIQQSWAKLLSLLDPRCEPLFLSTSVAPLQDLESYLMRPRLCLQLIPQKNDTIILKACPVPAPLARSEVDWDAVEVEMRDSPVFKLSEVPAVPRRRARYFYATEDGTVQRRRTLAPGAQAGGIIGIGTQYAGILMTYIPSPVSLLYLITAGNDGEVSIAERQKWYDQIADVVHTLHRHGLFWVDVKAANVAIDGVHREAWLVDFEGTATVGWVDYSISGTKAEDLQGLSKMREFLELSSTRPRRTGRRRGLARIAKRSRNQVALR
ncbi:hypothetical protein BO82DRAFT_392702 [Aspergillus uvarum CBS 121591]|uniref:Protein kinase domain-containing protein n=1 Tax=Aspergillus uvarum CBS 121591 TaxID=1448315 RepID=A0A319CB25_9EURO|nr:hypothetical protein BO82DRAFT_392702 [Aspergillus uvarum CBS 121591]PYH81021.1 hypothetical protein BO82DRAFT_392702 [Aspergillus uvarum CBS 121591]